MRERVLVAVLAIAAASVVAPAPAASDEAPRVVETVAIPVIRDAEVRSTAPTKAYGARPELNVDGDPESWTLLAFPLAQLGPGEVRSARLRIESTDRSVDAGRVHRTASVWTEGVTWSTRPAVDPEVLAAPGRVEASTTVDLALPPSVVTGNEVALAWLPASPDGARFAAREAGTPATLVIEIERPAEEPPPPDPDAGTYGASTVALSTQGSSNPTELATNQRVAITSGGRTLVAYGLHSQGVQLAWRDRGRPEWSRASGGGAATGVLLDGTSTGDWATSIVVGRAVDGTEHAWVVMGRDRYSSGAPIWFRRLSDHDDPAGPTFGPLQALSAAGVPTKRPDLAVATRPDGTPVLAVVWSEKVSSSRSSVRASWLDTDVDAPVPSSSTELSTGSGHEQQGSFVTGGDRLRLVVKGVGQLVRIHSHDLVDLAAPWVAGTATVAGGAGPTAPNGVWVGDAVLVALQVDAAAPTVVHRFAPDGSSVSTELSVDGHAMPILSAGDGRAWLVAVRAADGAVVVTSRDLDGWGEGSVLVSASDVGGNADWPNVPRRTDDRLRVLVRGAQGGTNRTAVVFGLAPA